MIWSILYPPHDTRCARLPHPETWVKGKRRLGYALTRTDGLLLGVYKLTLLGGSSYLQLPWKISNKKAVINHRNIYQYYFKWSILVRHVKATSNNSGISLKGHLSITVKFPDPGLSQLKLFECAPLNNIHILITDVNRCM